MGKRLTVLATALLLVWSMTAAAFAKEPEISVEIDQTGQDSAAAVITLGSEVYTSILVKVPGEPWYDFTWALEDVKSITLPIYENGPVQVQATGRTVPRPPRRSMWTACPSRSLWTAR